MPGASGDISDSGLRRLLDADVMGIVVATNAGTIVKANDTFLEIIGYTRDDLERGIIDWRRLTPPEWLPLDENAIAALADRGTFSPYDKEYLRKDGTRVPISVGGARIDGTDDQQICYIVDLSDIRRTEAALRRSESRFQRLADSNVIGIMISRVSDNAIVEANEEFLRMMGYRRDEFVRGSLVWTALTPPEWRAAGSRARAELLERGRFAPYEKEFYRKDGSRIAVLISGALLEGSEGEVISCVLDMSEQRETMRKLALSEQRYRILAQALPQIVMLTDENRRIEYVNRHYEEFTGIPVEELAERWLDVIHPDDYPAVERARATGLPYEIEYRLRRVDGVYRWHFARVMRVSSDAGEIHWLAAVIDIDDRKRAEDALRFMEKASLRFSQSLDPQTTFETLLDLVIPEFGDWAIVCLPGEDGVVRSVVARHRDPEKNPLARKFCGVDIYREEYQAGTKSVYLTGKPRLRSELTRDDVVSAIRPAYLPIYEELGYGSLIAVPILAGRDVVGSFTIVSAGNRRPYTAADLPALEELARRASFAIANAQQYEREHKVANSLQEAALPRSLPTIAGFGFDAYYRAGRQEAAIGGDWYDAILTPEGQLVISVGDVAGSGLAAAVLMGNLRQVIRAAAHVSTDPTTILDVADRMLRSEHDATMVTAFVGVIDPAERTITYASAGHLPALLRSPDGIVELDAPGPPLGCRHIAGGENRRSALPPGSVLVLYTDGLVEWSRDLVAGEALLRDRLASATIHADAHPARSLVERVLPPSGPRDDVAALIVWLDD
jgi:PAS domain S-box-containing protein